MWRWPPSLRCRLLPIRSRIDWLGVAFEGAAIVGTCAGQKSRKHTKPEKGGGHWWPPQCFGTLECLSVTFPTKTMLVCLNLLQRFLAAGFLPGTLLGPIGQREIYHGTTRIAVLTSLIVPGSPLLLCGDVNPLASVILLTFFASLTGFLCKKL